MKRMLIALLALMLLTAACASAPISAQPTAPQVATVPVIATATSMPAPTASEIPPTATNEPASATPEPPTPTTEPPTPTSEPATPTTGPATATTEPTEVAPTAAPTSPPATPVGDAAQGQVIWAQKPCSGCHGPEALGNIGPRLAGTSRTYEAVLNQVRTGKAPMPAFTPAQISDQEVAHIYAWLKSLPAAP